jgi:hypothetical protein
MPIRPTFNFVPYSWPKAIMHPQIITNPPPCFTVWWTCWGPTCYPSPIQHHDLLSELPLFMFVSSLKITHFQSWKVQFSYLWVTSGVREHVFDSETTSFVALVHPIQHLLKHASQWFLTTNTCFKSKLFCCHRFNSKLTFSNKSDIMPLLSVCKKLWRPSSLSLNLAQHPSLDALQMIGSCPL